MKAKPNQSILLQVILTLVILFVFKEVIKFGFTNWDDDKYVTEAEIIRNISLNNAFTTPTVSLYTPLTTLSFMLDFQLFGLNAKGYHAENLLLHLLCCLLILRLCLVLHLDTYTAFFVAILFGIHPLHVEPVVWVSSRKDLLFSLFYLAALIIYFRFLDNRKKLDYWICFLLFILSGLAKPTAISFPLVLIILIWFREGKPTMPNWRNIAPMLVVSIIIGMITIMVTKDLGLRTTLDEGYSNWQIFHFAGYGVGFYIIKILWPLGLSNYHAYPLPEMDLPWDYLIAPWVVLLLIGITVALWKKEPRLLFSLLLFLVILFPNYRFIPIGFPMVADRYGYLSSFGLLLILGLCFNYLLNIRNLKKALILFSILLIAVCMRVTYLQTQTWKSSLSMWDNSVKLYPFAYFPLQSRGEAYLLKGDKINALIDFLESYKLQPQNPVVANSIAMILVDMGKLAEALPYQDHAIQLDSSSTHLYNRGNTYKALENYIKAIQDYDRSIALNPNLGSAFNNRGVCKIMAADTLGAKADFEQAVRLEMGNQMFRDNLKRVNELIKK